MCLLNQQIEKYDFIINLNQLLLEKIILKANEFQKCYNNDL